MSGRAKRVPETAVEARADAVFRPDEPVDVQVVQLWLPNPRSPGTYFGRAELYSDDVLPEFADSKRFQIS